MRTLEEVKQHFKGVETAKCFVNGKKFNFEDADERGIHWELNSFWITNKKNGHASMVYSTISNEFAEIIEKENVFQFYSEILDEWLELSPDRKYRIKPDHSIEIAELERKIEILKNL
jgi:hypothetical protein